METKSINCGKRIAAITAFSSRHRALCLIQLRLRCGRRLPHCAGIDAAALSFKLKHIAKSMSYLRKRDDSNIFKSALPVRSETLSQSVNGTIWTRGICLRHP